MAKRNRNTTGNTIQKRIDEGRGQGVGADYRPWLQVQDVPSTGLASRIKGWKIGRIHHLFSRLETNFFFNLEWSQRVSDIREQFPLLPREETIAIAEKIGVRPPTDPKTQEPIVMTTDFLITVSDGPESREIARTVKPSDQLDSDRVLEKFEIERLYWEARQISWGIVTENEISEVVAKNVQWLHGSCHLGAFPALDALPLDQIEQVILGRIASGLPLAQITSQCDDRLGLPAGASLTAVRHLIATRRWRVNMDVLLEPSKPLQILGTASGSLISASINENSDDSLNQRVA
jgi:hypothetical protein